MQSFKNKINNKINNMNQQVKAVSTNASRSPANLESHEVEISKTPLRHSAPLPNLSDSQSNRNLSPRFADHETDLKEKQVLSVGDSILKLIKSLRFDRNRNTFIKTIRGGKVERYSKLCFFYKAAHLSE